jgi:hypothetical protein
MKRNRLEKYESKITPETSPEHLKQAREIAVNMIMNVFERMPKDNIKPVVESFSELARQAKEGVHRQSVIVQTSESEKKFAVQPTKNIMSDAENSAGQPTKFSNEELELLRQIQENA